MVLDYKRIVRAIGAAVVLLLLFIIGPMLVTSCSRKASFDNLYSQGRDCLQNGDFQEGINAVNQALEIEDKPELYILLSDIYMALDDIDKAIETLYTAAFKFNDKSVSNRLELLKARKSGMIAAAGAIEIAGQSVSLDETFLVLTNKRLTDISALSSLSSLRSLTLNGNLINNISPLEEMSRLGYLNLSGNQVIDVSPLSKLATLRSLNLDDNPITDFSPLYSLTSLETLSIKNIKISGQQYDDLTLALPNCLIYCETPPEKLADTDEAIQITLGGLTFTSDVTELDLSERGILDITSLSFCKNLRKLDLRGNAITDLSPLADLSQLNWLCIWNNRISDLTPLAQLYSLKYLDADNNEIWSLAPLSSLTMLEELWISYNEGIDTEALSNLRNLRRLGLKGLGLENDVLSMIQEFQNLEELALDDNDLAANSLDALKSALPGCEISHSPVYYLFEAGGISYQSDATSLDLSNCRLSDISGLEKFTQLKVLDLSGNSIRDASVLAKLTSLRELHLSANPIINIGYPQGLTSLSLDYTGWTDLEQLSSITSLTELSLEGNGITDISALASMPNLQKLYIANNSLTAEQIVQFLVEMPGCTVFTDLDLRGYVNS